MSSDRDLKREEQRRLKAAYSELYDDLLAMFFRHDPIGINFEDNADEYSPEVSTILPRLRQCKTEDDVCEVIYEEFQRWFSGDAGSKDKYSAIASDAWQLWQRFLAARTE